MKILHISAECYPMAKAGGLGDVVGALPKYLQELGVSSQVLIPMHRTAFLNSHEWNVVYKGQIPWKSFALDFTVIKERHNVLGFELFCVDINGLLDRTNIYGYADDADRFLAFQIAALYWISSFVTVPEILHLHDHHTGLIPFMMKYCFEFDSLKNIKTVFTIHNAQYQGWMSLEYKNMLTPFDEWKTGLLEWDNQINSLACAIKCSDAVTTVSPSYQKELLNSNHTLENLFQQEKNKCIGVLNGIDYKVWDPELDDRIVTRYDDNHVDAGKYFNKLKLCDEFSLNAELPLIVFIGRLVHEKSADLLSAVLTTAFEKYRHQFCCIVLGNGEPAIEQDLFSIQQNEFGYYHSKIEFNENLSHLLYAGADFLLMPSRVEPCGLNQMYAMRYGTIPIVRSVGGLKDTVIDLSDQKGYGICFEELTITNIVDALGRAIETYANKELVNKVRKNMMRINNSWTKSAAEYIDIYRSINPYQ